MRVCGLMERGGLLLLARHDGIGPAGHLWLPPGGGLEFAETAEHCLIREFEEECGVEVRPGSFYHLNEFIDPPLHAIELFYKVSLVSGEPTLGIDPEHTGGPAILAELKWFSQDEILQYKKDAMHAVSLRWAQE